MKFKPYLAATAAGVGLMAFASPALALSGDEAVDSDSPFRLNVYTLEPACFPAGHAALSSHLDLTALADGELAEELHVSVRKNASYSVDQVLVPGRNSGYSIYNTFDTRDQRQRSGHRPQPDRRGHVRARWRSDREAGGDRLHLRPQRRRAERAVRHRCGSG